MLTITELMTPGIGAPICAVLFASATARLMVVAALDLSVTRAVRG